MVLWGRSRNYGKDRNKYGFKKGGTSEVFLRDVEIRNIDPYSSIAAKIRSMFYFELRVAMRQNGRWGEHSDTAEDSAGSLGFAVGFVQQFAHYAVFEKGFSTLIQDMKLNSYKKNDYRLTKDLSESKILRERDEQSGYLEPFDFISICSGEDLAHAIWGNPGWACTKTIEKNVFSNSFEFRTSTLLGREAVKQVRAYKNFPQYSKSGIDILNNRFFVTVANICKEENSDVIDWFIENTGQFGVTR